MAFDWRTYNREQMRKRRAAMRDPAREMKMIAIGKCPVCEMLLVSTYHVNCTYLSTEEHTQDGGQTS